MSRTAACGAECPRGARERGLSLAELLVCVALLGLLVVMTAPIETFLLRSLGRVGAEGRDFDLKVAVALLAADARAARSVRWTGAGAITLVIPQSRSVTWTIGREGLTRQAGPNAARTFEGVIGFSGSAPSPGLLEAQLTSKGGAVRRLAVHLRNGNGAGVAFRTPQSATASSGG